MQQLATGQSSSGVRGSQKVSKKAKKAAGTGGGDGLSFKSRFVPEGVDPFDLVIWDKRSSKISNADGSDVFRMDDILVPAEWSQLATDIAVSKYFRKAGVPESGHEKSVKQLIYRVAHTIREAGEKFGGYFKTAKDAEVFEKELIYLLLTQRAAFNSPVWFNCGLHQRYGITGSGGNFRWDFETGDVVETTNSYEYPQCSACFIQSVNDDLMSIFDLVKSEARIFKFGSGTGTNFSKIRGSSEKLSGGGQSSGLMSFLEVLDRGAGATKSGGTTRRAAKMVILDTDHPEIEEFVTWKVREEKKVEALVAGGYSSDFNGDAYKTVSGQNGNNSVRITDEFMQAVIEDRDWTLKERTSGKVHKVVKARELWDKISYAAWKCADPGIQFDTTINKWHTCLDTDRINASNPCSEYMFLDDTACNLSSINLMKYLDSNGKFDVDGFREASRVMFVAQEILVDFSSYPTRKIAKNSHDYRPLGLGFANLGTMMMVKGIPYDSETALNWAGAITAIMTGTAYKTSSEMAKSRGPFPGYEKNSNSVMRVMKQHRDAAHKLKEPAGAEYVTKAAKEDWDDVVELSAIHGLRNAQATVLAPTGTIGLLMDCDTTGIEPDFSLVKFKKLAGGGYFKIVNQSVPLALKNLGYSPDQISAIVEYAVGTNSLKGVPGINTEKLLEKGLDHTDIAKIEKALPSAFDLNSAVSPWVLGEATLKRLNIDPQEVTQPGHSILNHFGFSAAEIEAAGEVVCGRLTLEGAPFLKPEHLAVFDCANKCGPKGQRFIKPMAHVHMMAAVQPFLSGAISKTVNLPNEATVKDIEDCYFESWKLGLKAVAVYRDGCKMSQPLNSSKTTSTAEEKKFSQEEVEVMVQKAVDEALKNAQSVLGAGKRRHLPQKRKGFTVAARVAGHKIFLRTGEYDDGRLGEIFVDMHKEGATFRSLLNCFAQSVSVGLQYGVPLEEFVESFTFTRFEPQGMVDHPNIKQATSIVDYIFRVLGMEYLGQTDFVHVKPDPANTAVGSREREIDIPIQLDMSTAMIPDSDTKNIVKKVSHLTDGDTPEKGSLSKHLKSMMGDAPMCNTCGHTTVRNGACYKCLNCGNSMGCS